MSSPWRTRLPKQSQPRCKTLQKWFLISLIYVIICLWNQYTYFNNNNYFGFITGWIQQHFRCTTEKLIVPIIIRQCRKHIHPTQPNKRDKDTKRKSMILTLPIFLKMTPNIIRENVNMLCYQLWMVSCKTYLQQEV